MPVAATEVAFSGPYSGNGATVQFDYDFKVYADSEIVATRVNADESRDTLTLTTDYTVSGVASGARHITLTSGALLPTGASLILSPSITLSQDRAIGDQSSLKLSEIELIVDKLTSIARQAVLNALVARPGDTVGEIAVGGANVVPKWDAGGNLVAGPTITQIEAAEAEAAGAAASALAAAASALLAGDEADDAADSADAAAASADAAAASAAATAALEFVPRDTATGAAQIPTGTTAQRPVAPVVGQLRENTTTGKMERYDGAGWVGVGGGAGFFKGENGAVGDATTGPGDIFRINEQTLNTDVTIGATENASAAGPLVVATGVALTVTSGGSLVIL